jgi:hypothetical protein
MIRVNNPEISSLVGKVLPHGGNRTTKQRKRQSHASLYIIDFEAIPHIVYLKTGQ